MTMDKPTKGLIVFLVLVLALGAYFYVFNTVWPADGAEPRQEDRASVAQRCVEEDGTLCAPPRVRAKRFRAGRYDTAAGRHVPARIYRLAKRYVRHHPGSTRPRAGQAGRDWDLFDPIRWMTDTLTRAQCIAVGTYMPDDLTDCDMYFDDWDEVQRVQVMCGGAGLLAFGASLGNPLAAGGATAGCYWSSIMSR